jgi:large subunit ribosomal protein L16
VIKPGRMLFEMEGIPRDVAKEALRLASHKLSLSTQFCERQGATYAS